MPVVVCLLVELCCMFSGSKQLLLHLPADVGRCGRGVGHTMTVYTRLAIFVTPHSSFNMLGYCIDIELGL